MGYTFAEIQEAIGIPIAKSSLSYICKNVQLPAGYYAKVKLLNANHLNSVRESALKRNREIYRRRSEAAHMTANSLVDTLDPAAIKISLAMLYLGEGSKWPSFRGLQLGSSSPLIIKLYVRLLTNCYGILPTALHARIQCRFDQDASNLLEYWSTVSGVPADRFYKTYADTRTQGKPTKRNDYKGVCVIIGGSTEAQLELAAIAEALLDKMGL